MRDSCKWNLHRALTFQVSMSRTVIKKDDDTGDDDDPTILLRNDNSWTQSTHNTRAVSNIEIGLKGDRSHRGVGTYHLNDIKILHTG